MNTRCLSLLSGIFVVLLWTGPSFADPPSEPVAKPTKNLWYFIVDKSGSIGTSKLVDPFHEAAVNFVNTLSADTELDIVFFNDKATPPRSWHPLDLQAKGEFDRYFTENLKPDGETLLYDTVGDVFSRVVAKEKDFRKITLVILSDGEDNKSTKYKSWADLEKLLPEAWVKRRGDFAAVWVTVGFEPKPENKPRPDGPITQRTISDKDKSKMGGDIAKAIIPAPNAAFTANPMKVKINEPILFALQDDSNVAATKWTFGDGETSKKRTETHAFKAKGTYNVAVDVEGPGGKARVEKKAYIQVVEEVPLEAGFSWHPLVARINEEIKFADESLGSPTSWSWEFPEVGARKERNPTVAFSKPGKVTVTLTIEKEGKKHSFQQELNVLPLPPDAGFSAEPSELEKGQVLHLKASKNEDGWTHKWSIGEQVLSEGVEAEWTADRLGRIEVVHSVQGPGGLVDKGFTVFVKEKADVLAARFRWSPVEVHLGEQIQFVDESSGAPKTWTWEIPGIGSQRQHNPSVTFSKLGKITVKLTVERDGKQASCSKDLEVLAPVLNLQAIFEAVPVKGQIPLTVQFKDKSKGEIASWRWEFGDGKTSDLQNPTHTYEEAKNYIPRLVIRNSKGEEARDTGGATIIATPPLPLWIKALILLGIVILGWVIVVVPFILRPLIAPQKGVAFRSTTVNYLRVLARRGSNFLWPCGKVTIGAGRSGDLKVGGVGQKNELLARVSRVPATGHYELVALQANAVCDIRKQKAPDGQETKQLVPIVPGKPRSLRDGDQFDVRGTMLTWMQPGGKKR